LGHLLAILRASAVFSALRPSFIYIYIREPNPLGTQLRICLVLELAHMMPTKHPLVQNEVVRLEVLRLDPLMPYSSKGRWKLGVGRSYVRETVPSACGWIAHNAGFEFLDIASATLGVFASLDRL
jgi:hypothetical protein